MLAALFSPAWVEAAAPLAPTQWDGLTETVFQNYGRDQGLPPPVPTTLAQDSNGFIWIGTQGGLVRWDGYRFRAYNANGVPGSLPGDWIAILHTDAAGELWIGTDADGLARYDRTTDRFIPVPLRRAGTTRMHVGAIADDGAGGLWVGTNQGLYHLDAGARAAALLHPDPDGPASLPDDAVQALLRDRQDALWIGTGRGLARRGADGRLMPISLPGATGAAAGITALFQDASGRIWVGTAQQGLYAIDAGATQPHPVDTGNAFGGPGRTDRVTAISKANDHEIWVGMRAAGIVAFDLDTGQSRHIRHDRLLADSLAHDDVSAIMQDRAGSMWVGSMAGLSYHPKDLGAVATVFGGSSRPDGVTDPDISAVLATRDGHVWLGFLSGGVDIVDPAGGRVAQLRPDGAHSDMALPQDVVTSMTQAENGDVYIGTPRGAYRADMAGRAVSLLTPMGRDPHALVREIVADHDVLWLGGPDGLRGNTLGDQSRLVFGPADSAKLTDQSIFSVLRGLGQDMWIGTGNGLSRLDLTTGHVEAILPNPADPTKLPGRLVCSLLLDREGRLWTGTFGGGVAVMLGRNAAGVPQFRRFGIAEGLPQSNVDKILLDGQGNIWVSTDNGLAVIDPATFKIRVLQRAEGSTLTEYWVKSGDTDHAGEPLFGAKGGLSVVRPGWPQAWNIQPPLAISDVRVGEKPVPGGGFAAALRRHPVMVGAHANSLAAEFTALDFTAPERNRYAYKLDGFDRDWIDTDATRRLAAYTNLPPGNYVLRLRGSNRDGVWAARELDVPVRVLPLWYQTMAFKLAVVAAAVMAVAMLVRGRTAYLRQRQRGLEQQIANRTADLNAANTRLFDLANRDPLTGCLNRRRFTERSNELIAVSDRHGTSMSMVIMDLDNFKRVNDVFGHPMGDEVLRVLGGLNQFHVRESDLLCRLGGEEFALLLPHTTAESASLLAERLRRETEEAAIRLEDATIRVTISLGVAERRPNESFDALYGRADAALYTAKLKGRNRVVVHAKARISTLDEAASSA